MRSILILAHIFAAILYQGCGAPLRSSELSATSSMVSGLFTRHYNAHYQSGRCGDNIKGFVAALKAAGENLDHYRVVLIRNTGFSVFGMVNAELARGTSFNRPVAEERNWYHHVILVDTRTMNVFDFDYATKPTIVDLDHYIQFMFLNETECSNRSERGFCAGEETKLDDYEWEVVRAWSLGISSLPGNKARMRHARSAVGQF